MTQVLHVPADHPLNRLAAPLRGRLVRAQSNLVENEFKTAADLCRRACADLKVTLDFPPDLDGQDVTTFADQPHKDLIRRFAAVLTANGVPEQSVVPQATTIAHRVQLLRAFDDPDAVVSTTCEKVAEIIAGFPTTAEQIRRGRNPGDVLDPYILAAVRQLMFAGDFEATVSATVAHKALMMIEGLIGHLHEDVIGAMRGNVRVPEPRGANQRTLDPATNPFPGADVVQPPIDGRRTLRCHQVKSKTGSAKGGDGERLGLQLEALRGLYGGEIYYDALIGNTLRGHRSMTGVRAVAPDVIVLVGESAFAALTESTNGPQLLLRLYQSAFDVAATRAGYSIQGVVAGIYSFFKQRSDQHGEDFLETVLRDAVGGVPADQDSRQLSAEPRVRGRRPN